MNESLRFSRFLPFFFDLTFLHASPSFFFFFFFGNELSGAVLLWSRSLQESPTSQQPCSELRRGGSRPVVRVCDLGADGRRERALASAGELRSREWNERHREEESQLCYILVYIYFPSLPLCVFLTSFQTSKLD